MMEREFRRMLAAFDDLLGYTERHIKETPIFCRLSSGHEFEAKLNN